MCLAPMRRRQKADAAEMLDCIKQRERRGEEGKEVLRVERGPMGHGEGLGTGGAGDFKHCHWS